MRTKAQLVKEIKALEGERLKLKDLTTDPEYKELQEKLLKRKEKLDDQRQSLINENWVKYSVLTKELSELKEKPRFEALAKVVKWRDTYFSGVEGKHIIHWHTPDGRFVIIREPGATVFAGRGEQKYYQTEYQLFDLSKGSHFWGGGPYPHVYTWGGRMNKEVFKKFQELIAEKRKEERYGNFGKETP